MKQVNNYPYESLNITLYGYVEVLNGAMDWMHFNWDRELKAVCKSNYRILFLDEDARGIDKINNSAKVLFTKTLTESSRNNTVLAKSDLITEIIKLKTKRVKIVLFMVV